MLPYLYDFVSKLANAFGDGLGLFVQLSQGFAMFRMFCFWFETRGTPVPMAAMELIHCSRCFVISIYIIFPSYLILSSITCMSYVDTFGLTDMLQPFYTAFAEILSIFFYDSQLCFRHMVRTIYIHAQRGNGNLLKRITASNFHKKLSKAQTCTP